MVVFVYFNEIFFLRVSKYGWAVWETVPFLLLFQQGWNITVDLVIGPKGIRQLTSQDTKVERAQE